MVIRDIFAMMRSFERARLSIFMMTYIVGGAVLSVAHDAYSGLYELFVRMESTYPPVLLLLTNLALGSAVRLIATVTVAFVTMLFIGWLSVSYAPDDARNFATWRKKIRIQLGVTLVHLKPIYKLCLLIAMLDTIFAGLLHLVMSREVSHFLFNHGDAGFFQLMGLIGDRWIECALLFGALFALTQNEGSRLNYGRFLMLSLTDKTNDLVYTGCMYYALLFGCVDYLATQFAWFSHAPLFVSPIALLYVVSMYLLGNGVHFPNEVVAEKA